MKKILLLLLFLILCSPQVAFAKKKAAVVVPSGSGYVGTLPNLNEKFQKSVPEDAKPTFDSQDNFNSQDDIKPAPRNNPAFINIIMKTDKSSQYLNDLNSLISILEDLQTAIEDKSDVQKFNAQAYYLKSNVEYFRDNYKNKAESSYISFKKVMQINTHVQAVSQLRREREVYSPYVTEEQSGNAFSNNNIDTQLDYLLDEIKSGIAVLKEDK